MDTKAATGKKIAKIFEMMSCAAVACQTARHTKKLPAQQQNNLRDSSAAESDEAMTCNMCASWSKHHSAIGTAVPHRLSVEGTQKMPRRISVPNCCPVFSAAS